MEALMQHYQAAAPMRPSANRMYDDRWHRFAHRAAGQGIDPLCPTAAQIGAFLFYLFDTHSRSPKTIDGYRSWLSSVLSPTVQVKSISDMITSMEQQGPRMTMVLPQWDLGIVLEALSKPPYEPLREVS